MITHYSIKKAFGIGLAFSIFATSTAFADTVGTINANDVNIRATSSTDAVVLTKADNGETVTVTADLDGWFRISAPSVGTAYVTSQYVSINQADGKVTGSSVNIRAEANTTAKILGTANTGDLLSVIGSTGDWYIVEYKGTKAYVYKQYVQGDMLKYVGGTSAAATPTSTTSNVYATVSCSGTLNMRSQPNTNASVVVNIPNGYNLSVYDYSNGWVKVSDDSGRTGYVKSEYISLKNGSKPANKPASNTTSTSGNAAKVIAYAKQFIGTPYVYGGTNLKSGVDCSGYVYAVYQNFGINLNRSSRDQYSNGTKVTSTSNLQPGDLVFFNTGGNSAISHVGIYIGGGQYIHSTDGAAMGVTISNLSSAYSSNTYVGATRVL